MRKYVLISGFSFYPCLYIHVRTELGIRNHGLIRGLFSFFILFRPCGCETQGELATLVRKIQLIEQSPGVQTRNYGELASRTDRISLTDAIDKSQTISRVWPNQSFHNKRLAVSILGFTTLKYDRCETPHATRVMVPPSWKWIIGLQARFHYLRRRVKVCVNNDNSPFEGFAQYLIIWIRMW